MKARWLALGPVAATLGALALLVTPHGAGRAGQLAAAGSDVPLWAVILIALALLAGLVLIILGSRRRRDREDDPDPASPVDAPPATGAVAHEEAAPADDAASATDIEPPARDQGAR